MPATKTDIVLQTSASNLAGATTTGTGVDISAGYGVQWSVRITNGATAPTVECQCDIEVSNDNIDYYIHRTVYGSTVNNDIVEASDFLPIGAKWIRTVFHGNTGQSVTIEADGSNVTGI